LKKNKIQIKNNFKSILPATNEHHLVKVFVIYPLHQMLIQLLSQELIYLLPDHTKSTLERIPSNKN